MPHPRQRFEFKCPSPRHALHENGPGLGGRGWARLDLTDALKVMEKEKLFILLLSNGLFQTA
jgi:hypothetical protein